MRPLCSLAFAALLAVGGSIPVRPLTGIESATPKESCPQTSTTAPQRSTEEPAVRATVTQIDRERGILDLETEAGHVQVAASPSALQDLQVGDRLVLCLADEAPSQNLLQDDIIT